MSAQPKQPRMETIDAAVLAMLACPACRGSLSLGVGGAGVGGAELACVNCGRAYAVVDGIPVLIVERSGTSNGRETGN
jgi:uncharacterized protein